MSEKLPKPNINCDMHTHTTRSDGLCTLKEVLDFAVDGKMKIIAVTDHDVLPEDKIEADGKTVKIKSYLKGTGVCYIGGCEFSCDTDVDDVHITVYGCDWNNEEIQKVMKKISDSKVESYLELLERLNKRGYEITLDEVLNYDGVKRTKEDIQKKLIFNLMADKGYTNTWSDAKKMVKKDKELNVRRKKPSPADIIDKVHKAGGIAILAHPYLIDEEVILNVELVTRAKYIDYLIENGLDGIEADYTYDKTTYTGDKLKEEVIQEVKDRYTDRVKIISGGSDFHGEHKKNAENPRYVGECGITYMYFIENELLNKLI